MVSFFFFFAKRRALAQHWLCFSCFAKSPVCYRDMRWDLLIVMMLVGSTECLGTFIRPLRQLYGFALRSVRARSG